MTRQPSETLVTVIGASGFIGRHIVRALAKRGYRIRAACRRPDLAGHLQPLGVPGQIMPVQANVRYPASLDAVYAGADVVINATGTDVSSGAQSFDAVLVFGAEAVAKAARTARSRLLITVSGIGADRQGTSDAARAKGEGEARAAQEFPGAIAVRPSVVFGPEDRFFNKLAGMARFSPVIPVFGGGETRIQPVFVGDIAEAVARLVDKGVADGRIYELGGPEVLTLRQLTQFTLDTTARKRMVIPIPFSVARIIGMIAGLLPKPPITADQVELLKSDNVVSEEANREGRTLKGLGIAASGIEGIVPSYLYRFRKAGQFTAPKGMPE
ncbi:MAG: complex I NDUFA9 subunit family protein [Aestuariivirga sp.]